MLVCKSKIFFALLLVCGMCTSCKNPHKMAHLWARGMPNYGDNNDWQKGWDDACATMTSIGAAGWFRSLPTRLDGWKMTGKSPEISNGDLYYKGFIQGREHCFYELDYWSL